MRFRISLEPVKQGATWMLVGLIWVYRRFVSPFLSSFAGTGCRFSPTCSEYARQALIKHGPGYGSLLAIRRVLRCRPGGGWGYDPVPATLVNDDARSAHIPSDEVNPTWKPVQQ